jgi:hypothetical protein
MFLTPFQLSFFKIADLKIFLTRGAAAVTASRFPDRAGISPIKLRRQSHASVYDTPNVAARAAKKVVAASASFMFIPSGIFISPSTALSVAIAEAASLLKIASFYF